MFLQKGHKIKPCCKIMTRHVVRNQEDFKKTEQRNGWIVMIHATRISEFLSLVPLLLEFRDVTLRQEKVNSKHFVFILFLHTIIFFKWFSQGRRKHEYVTKEMVLCLSAHDYETAKRSIIYLEHQIVFGTGKFSAIKIDIYPAMYLSHGAW